MWSSIFEKETSKTSRNEKYNNKKLILSNLPTKDR